MSTNQIQTKSRNTGTCHLHSPAQSQFEMTIESQTPSPQQNYEKVNNNLVLEGPMGIQVYSFE